MILLVLCALLVFGPTARAVNHPPRGCEISLAEDVSTLNVLWDVFDKLRQRHAAGEAPNVPRTVDFLSFAQAKRFLRGLMFVDDFLSARQNDAEAVQTYLLWWYERRRLEYELNARRAAETFGLADALDSLAEYVARERYAPMIGGVLGRPSRLHLDIRVHPQLPQKFWPTVHSTLNSGVLADGDEQLYFVKFNGFVHVLRPREFGRDTDYAVYKIANRANVGGPLHFSYFLELIHDDLGLNLEHMTDLQDLFFHRYYLLRDLMPTGAPQP